MRPGSHSACSVTGTFVAISDIHPNSMLVDVTLHDSGALSPLPTGCCIIRRDSVGMNCLRSTNSPKYQKERNKNAQKIRSKFRIGLDHPFLCSLRESANANPLWHADLAGERQKSRRAGSGRSTEK